MTQLEPVLKFTREEIDVLGDTADAMTAYMGKPVLAEIMSADETGAEWVAFGMPLDVNDEIDADSMVVIQLGGLQARYAGNRGGLDDDDHDVYDCECLWIIQLSDEETGRYVKVDPLNQEYAASNELQELLPFSINDENFVAHLVDDEDDEDTADDGDDTRVMDSLLDNAVPPSRRLH